MKENVSAGRLFIRFSNLLGNGVSQISLIKRRIILMLFLVLLKKLAKWLLLDDGTDLFKLYTLNVLVVSRYAFYAFINASEFEMNINTNDY